LIPIYSIKLVVKGLELQQQQRIQLEEIMYQEVILIID